MRAFDAVIFDFDGVIANSEPLHYHCFREVARQCDIDLTKSDYYANLIGYDDRGAWRKIFALRNRAIDDARIAQLMRSKTEVMHQLVELGQFTALPGVQSLLQKLHEQKIPVAIYSGARRIELEPILAALKLQQYFSIITTAEDVRVGKPDPSGYILTAEHLSQKIGRELRPERCLVIEDAPNVAARAREIGFNVLGVTSSAPIDAWDDEMICVPSLADEHLRTAKFWD